MPSKLRNSLILNVKCVKTIPKMYTMVCSFILNPSQAWCPVSQRQPFLKLPHEVFSLKGHLREVLLKLEVPERLVKTQVTEPQPCLRIADSVGLGWGLRICISNKCPGEALCCCLGPHFENHCHKE